MTFLVYIVLAGQHSEQYVVADTAEQAVAAVRASLPAFERRWANVFA